MGGALEACALLDSSPLPPARVAPLPAGDIDMYWPRQQPSLAAGQAVVVRGRTWLVDRVDVWSGRPGGTQAHADACNAAGTLTVRAAYSTPYGLEYDTEQPPIDVIGVLRITASSDTAGDTRTTATLVPVGPWAGRPGDILTLSDGRRWEQVGDLTDAGSPPLPTVTLRRARDGHE